MERKSLTIGICVIGLESHFQAIVHTLDHSALIIVGNLNHVPPSIEVEKYIAAKERVVESFIIKPIEELDSVDYEIFTTKNVTVRKPDTLFKEKIIKIKTIECRIRPPPLIGGFFIARFLF